jgi:peroxiredoxin Q/BCP
VGSFLGFASRQAFLIKDGKIIWHDAKASTAEQAADVLKVVGALKK